MSSGEKNEYTETKILKQEENGLCANEKYRNSNMERAYKIKKTA